MSAELKFNIHASTQSVNEFVSRFIVGNHNLNVDACMRLVAYIKTSSIQWNRYQSPIKNKPSGFIFIQNHEVISYMYFELGWCAETIVKHIPWPCRLTPDTIRGYLNTLFRARTDYEKTIKHNNNYRNAGSFNARPDLVGFECEVIRLYKIGVSSECIAKEFNCSPDHIRSVLRFNGVMTEQNRQLVRDICSIHKSNIAKMRTPEEKQKIREKTAKTRAINGSSAKGRSSYIKTIRKRYNDPSIVSISQVPYIHENSKDIGIIRIRSMTVLL